MLYLGPSRGKNLPRDKPYDAKQGWGIYKEERVRGLADSRPGDTIPTLELVRLGKREFW